MTDVNELYEPLYTSNKRYFFLTGGRASLKSSSVNEFIARLTYEKGHGILFTRYTMASAKKSVIPDFKITLDRLGVTNDFEILADSVKNKRTGSFIMFSGIKTSSGDQTANLKGIAGVTTWVIDEGEDYHDEKSFTDIDDSIRTKGIQNRVIWIQNPTTKEHVSYKRWIEPKPKQIKVEGFNVEVSGMEDVEHIHTTYHIAEQYLSKSWLDKANKSKSKMLLLPKDEQTNSHYYYNYIGGWLLKSEGVIFPNWEIGEFNNNFHYCFGLDFGYNDPDALIKCTVDERNEIVYADEVLYKSNSGNAELIKMVKSRIHNISDLIVADPNESRMLNDLYYSGGLNIIKAKKPKGSVSQRYNKLQGYKIVVTERSVNLIKELNNHTWHDKISGIPAKDKWHHCLDALMYGLSELYM